MTSDHMEEEAGKADAPGAAGRAADERSVEGENPIQASPVTVVAALRWAEAGLESVRDAVCRELALATRQIDREVAARHRAERAASLSEQRFAKTFRMSPAALSIATAAEGRFLDVNDAFLRIAGYDRNEVAGRTGDDLSLWAEPEERKRLLRVLAVQGSLWNREYGLRTRSGGTRFMLASAETTDLEGQECILEVAADITERKRAQAALEASEERYALAARGANDGLWDWNLATGEIYFSSRWKQVLGHADDPMNGGVAEWFGRVHPGDRDRLGMEIVSHLEGLAPHFESEHRMQHADGRYRWVLCRGLAISDELGRATRMAGSQSDITRHKALEEQLVHDAFHDALSGLPNRALFTDRLGRAVERAKRCKGSGFAVVLLDLHRFGAINDGLGQPVGDRVLREVGRRLEASLRPQDTVARVGGDEFAILLEQVADASDATRVAERTLDDVARPLEIDGREVVVEARVGIAVSATEYDRAEDALRDAGTALHRAKSLGRSRYELFDRAMHERAVARLEMESQLRRACERGEFSLHYQPIVRIETGRLCSFEALLRWSHPLRGNVPPAEFIPIAEETGQIVPLGLWVLREACLRGREWLDRFGDAAVPISVNVSSRQLADDAFVESARDILAMTGLPGRFLTLEITESSLMDNPASVAARLERLRAFGVRVSLDDFGMGHSCLSLLHSVPIDTLKIDRSFVARIRQDGTSPATVRAVVALAQSLGMDAVAEGVEWKSQLEALRALSCGFAQGNFFSQPLPAGGATETLQVARRW